MATREVVTLICDVCSSENDAETHSVTIDGKAVELEACPKCWGKFMKTFEKVQECGRRIRRRRKSAA